MGMQMLMEMLLLVEMQGMEMQMLMEMQGMERQMLMGMQMLMEMQVRQTAVLIDGLSPRVGGQGGLWWSS